MEKPHDRNELHADPADHQRDNLPLCLWARPSSPPCVYFLADHLDAVLAAGEDLLRLDIVWISAAGGTPEATVRDREDLRASVEVVRSLELTLIARLLKSRERAEELIRLDARLKLVARLFLTGTLPVLDALQEMSDATSADFETGDAILAYLRQRDLLAADAAAPEEGAVLDLTEKFPIARRLPLGALMDLVAEFLDTIELHHDIYADQWTRQGPAQGERVDHMSETDIRKAPVAAAAPPGSQSQPAQRPAYRSLRAALAALEAEEVAKLQPAG